MYIGLTNANPKFLNKKLLLKKDLIVSVYEGSIVWDEENPIEESVTLVYMPPHGEWRVKESVDEIVRRLKMNLTQIK
jgi:hypothetical protein